jgi:DNA-binding transcriptional regulator YiaG
MENENNMTILDKDIVVNVMQLNPSDEEMAQQLNISVPNVVYLRELYGLQSPRKNQRQNAMVITKEELLELQKELKTDKNISERLGFTLSQVFTMRKLHNIPMLHKGRQDNLIQQDDDAKIKFLFSRIKEIRREQKIKQYTLAKRLGISTTHLRNYEHGKRYPRTKLLIQIINELNINPNYLFLEAETRKYLQ